MVPPFLNSEDWQGKWTRSWANDTQVNHFNDNLFHFIFLDMGYRYGFTLSSNWLGKRGLYD